LFYTIRIFNLRMSGNKEMQSGNLKPEG